jgi:hypothetical protein
VNSTTYYKKKSQTLHITLNSISFRRTFNSTKMNSRRKSNPEKNQHKRWAKASHWIVTLAFLLLFFSGIEILMVHPRLYWGEVGNELTPALLELPISRNHRR